MPFMELMSIAVAVFIGTGMAGGFLISLYKWDREEREGRIPPRRYLLFPLGCLGFTLAIVLLAQ